MSLLNLCKKYFGKKNLYEVFDIEKTATEKEIKRAYHRLSLKIHPDRVPEEEKAIATEKFKVVSAVHIVLSNQEKRKIYDDTGSIDVEDSNDIKVWSNYWRSIFKEVTEQDIINYEKKYKGSDEEIEDLKKAYVLTEGDMNKILEYVMFSHPDDEARYGEIIDAWIDEGTVPAFTKYTNEPILRKYRRRNKFKKEAEMAEKESRKRKSPDNPVENSMDALVKAMQGRQKNYNAFLDNLEAKYSTKKPQKKENNTDKRNKRK